MTTGGGAEALAATIDAYCACWRVMDDSARRAALARCVSPYLRYTDPTVELTGIAALSAHIAKVCAARPDAVIARTGGVDAHHGMARFGWSLRDGDAVFLAGSIDVVELDPESGRLTRITGFFGPLEG
ncbi:hypothetical protein [Oceanicola sp. 502str15]|uniref:hypothetical protein n=1 Tax=Oceanicola sp. 502str15 TaxID=2696061 RepID=UPI002095B32B|nr:hypothetical protein [Oceanicola sp. 502str15]MCO6383590.1 nuclear transport factor 2 family protein [Oceanicola sp. 502str15]